MSSILDTDIRDIGSGLATLGKALWNGEIDLVEVAKDAGTEVAVEATYLATHADVFMPFSDKYTDQEICEAGVRVGAVLLAVSPSKKAKSITNTVENAAHLAKKVENDGTQKILKKCEVDADVSISKVFAISDKSRNVWSNGTFDSVDESLIYHFKTHGAQVGAADIDQYVRKADAFKQNLKGAKKSYPSEGTAGAVRYTKNGKYIILGPDGKILSFGLAR
ncbi:MAG: hypothetical protein E7195_02130 [Peptococcaceae bacterium]|nr:hypothetical protein [Peptococcaceae bacterium]MBR2626812.1 hypothetical protein [Peptococcaceae bacterium]